MQDAFRQGDLHTIRAAGLQALLDLRRALDWMPTGHHTSSFMRRRILQKASAFLIEALGVSGARRAVSPPSLTP